MRSYFFMFDPERTHEFVLKLLTVAEPNQTINKIVSKKFSFFHPSLQFKLLGHQFSNPVGLASGFDKNCKLFNVLHSLGFGFAECGTVTPLPQSGNPKPRIFRLKKESALINRLGFNSFGADWAVNCLKKNAQSLLYSKTASIMWRGISIGKNTTTPIEDAVRDYLVVFEKLHPFANYIAINVSCPNTGNLTELQKDLSPLLSALQNKNSELAVRNQGTPKPVFVKISPDLTFEEINQVAECCIRHRVSGLIATNTTTSRDGLRLSVPIEGGLSGKPLDARSTEIVRYLYKNYGKKLIIIGVGGIFSAEDAYRKIKAGASLVQLYTGWIYEGPSAVSSINRGLVRLLERDGLKNIQDAIGVETK